MVPAACPSGDDGASISPASNGVRAAAPAAPGSTSACNDPGPRPAPRPAAEPPASGWRAIAAALTVKAPAASPSACRYIWAMSVSAVPVRISSSWAAVFEASIAAASAANDIAACAETSSPPAGISPVNDSTAAAAESRPRLPISTNCAPMSPAAGWCDMESICVLLPPLTPLLRYDNSKGTPRGWDARFRPGEHNAQNQEIAANSDYC